MTNPLLENCEEQGKLFDEPINTILSLQTPMAIIMERQHTFVI